MTSQSDAVLFWSHERGHQYPLWAWQACNLLVICVMSCAHTGNVMGRSVVKYVNKMLKD